ncbi:MAG: hypothetical protein KKG34_00840, partial [Proteobacteria bacterium]|nr:hypothetical protein [Pseudomonadota bacterium]
LDPGRRGSTFLARFLRLIFFRVSHDLAVDFLEIDPGAGGRGATTLAYNEEQENKQNMTAARLHG